MKSLTKEEIIRETIAYYSEDVSRRAVCSNNPSRCEYLSENGNLCAVGRCMTKKGLDKVKSRGLNRECIYELERKTVFQWLLRSRYQGHDSRFWEDLQNLHDFRANWNSSGLSRRGKTDAEELLCKYKEEAVS